MSRRRALEATAGLALERLPDAGGSPQWLVTAEDACRMVERGLEVRLLEVIRPQPLPPSLVMSDEQSWHWIEEALGVKRDALGHVPSSGRPPKGGR